MGENNIFAEAEKMAEVLNKLETIAICKSNEHLWKDGNIEVIVGMSPPYVTFKVAINEDDLNEDLLTGHITEVWYWDEDFCAIPLLSVDLFSWTSIEITISFNNEDASIKEEEELGFLPDGHMTR